MAGMSRAGGAAVLMKFTRTEKKRGFTLLEIIVALALIGTILGILSFRLQGMQDQRKSEQARGHLRLLQSAIQSYYLHHTDSSGNHYYPSGSDWQSSDLINSTPNVLTSVLIDPFQSSQTAYTYYTSSNGKFYAAFSIGPDGAAKISGISDIGKLTAVNGSAVMDDIFVTNGTGTF